MEYTLDELRGIDRFDSRDLIETAEALVAELDAGKDIGEDGRELLAAIHELEADSSSEWTHGAFYIAETAFEEYAQELAEDIGAINSDAQWPLYCIDWERAARDLSVDYSSVEFLGTSYYTRD